MTQKSNPVYWLPLGGDQDNTVAALASRGSATKLLAIQDPIDSANLRGTIVGGTIEVTVDDNAAGQLVTPPELIIGIWPAAVNPPASYTAAAMKEYEDFVWIRQLMDPLGTHNAAAAETKQTWRAAIKLTTKRRIQQRGERIGIGILNHDAGAFGAAATMAWMLDLYMVLEG